MTSQMNLEEIYIELNELLKDVCSFLTSEANNEGLSAKAKTEAQKLVSRSKEQVDVISKISALQESSNSNYPYLKMQSPNTIPEPLGDYVEADFQPYESDYELADYAEVKHDDTLFTTVSTTEEECPYLHVLQGTLSENSEKYGPLKRKERYFLIGPKKHIYAGLFGCYLLIYNSCKKDIRPSEFVNLMDYKAQVLENREDFAFEITAPGKKLFQFMARSSKDMNQWVFAINYKKQRVSHLPNSAQGFSGLVYEEDLQTYETVDHLQKHKTPQPNNLVNKEECLQPELPLRTHNNPLRSRNTNAFSLTDNKNMKADNEDLEEDDEDEDNIYHSVVINLLPIAEEANHSVKKPIDTRNITLIEKSLQNHASSMFSVFEEINKDKDADIRDSITDEELVDYDEPRDISLNYNNKNTPNIPHSSSFRSFSNTKREMATNEELPIYDNTADIPQKSNENTVKKPKIKPEVPVKTISKPVISSPKPKEITSTFPRKLQNSDKTEGLTNIQKICKQIETAKIFKPKS